MSQDVVPASRTSFIRAEEHDLASTGRKVAQLSDKALEVLEQGLYSEDEKTRMDCARTLIKMNIDISKIINEDAMNRLIAEFRVNQNNLPQPKDVTPLVDFSKIQEV